MQMEGEMALFTEGGMEQWERSISQSVYLCLCREGVKRDGRKAVKQQDSRCGIVYSMWNWWW